MGKRWVWPGVVGGGRKGRHRVYCWGGGERVYWAGRHRVVLRGGGRHRVYCGVGWEA